MENIQLSKQQKQALIAGFEKMKKAECCLYSWV